MTQGLELTKNTWLNNSIIKCNRGSGIECGQEVKPKTVHSNFEYCT